VAEDALNAEIDRIAAIPDLEEQGRAVAALIRTLDEGHKRAVEIRRAVVLGLRSSTSPETGRPYSHAEVGRVLGIVRETAAQIAAGKQTGRRRTLPAAVDEAADAGSDQE
jgi:hypothetical protein